jgi:Pertussis toxin, subunit 1
MEGKRNSMLKTENKSHPSEILGKKKPQSHLWRWHWPILAMFVIALISGSVISITRAAGGETSNINNRYLSLSGETLPGRLYRGDSRPPDDIFFNGFTAQGTNYNLVTHVEGRAGRNTGYVSTTGTLSVAEHFADGVGVSSMQDIIAKNSSCSTVKEFFYTLISTVGQFLLGGCSKPSGNPIVETRTYVYEIDPAYAQNAYYVPAAIRSNEALYRDYADLDEWAYVYHIPREAIVGVHVYQMTANVVNNNTLDTRTVSFTNLNEFVANPYYGTTTHVDPHYNPANDTQSSWSYNTDPNLPTPTCPANPQVEPTNPCS